MSRPAVSGQKMNNDVIFRQNVPIAEFKQNKNPQNVSLRGTFLLGSEGTRPPYGINSNIHRISAIVNL